MTQIELELKQNQLFRAYCAQAEPLRKELTNNDIKLRATRQAVNYLYEELHDLRDHRAEIERKLRELKTWHMEQRAVVLREFQASQAQSTMTATPTEPTEPDNTQDA